jgi:hypothetical protein
MKEKVTGNIFGQRGNIEAENISANIPGERHSQVPLRTASMPSRGWTRKTGVTCKRGSIMLLKGWHRGIQLSSLVLQTRDREFFYVEINKRVKGGCHLEHSNSERNAGYSAGRSGKVAVY